MAEKMYKSTFGWVVADEKHVGTHILLTNEEYGKLIKIIKIKDDEIQNKIEKYEEDIEEINQEYDEIIENYKVENQNLSSRIEKLTKELKAEKSIKQNLIRINKERSNQERNLEPKKEHTGYVVLQSMEKEISYREQKKIKKVIIWETIIQTPYKTEFAAGDAKKQIFQELLTPEGGAKISNVGIQRRNIVEYSKLSDEEKQNQNTVFEIKYKANYNKGYWECIVRHTMSLKSIPKEMLPVLNDKKF